MASNGNDPRLEALENTLRGVSANAALQAVQPAGAAGAAAREGGDEHNVMALVSMLALRCRAMTDAMASNAASDKVEADEFCNHVLDLFRRWGADQIKRKRSELGELEAFLGKVGKS